MKLAIVGPGAMGRLFAWYFVEGGHRPVMVCRRAEQAEKFRREGLQVTDFDGVKRQVQVEAVSLAEGIGDVAGVLVAVKSYATRTAGQWLRNMPVVPVLSMQNGLGNGEILAEEIDPRRLAVGLTTHGATGEGDVHVHHRGRGNTIIGNWSGEEKGPAAFWLDVLRKSGHMASLSSEIRTEVWRKAMINIGINPFTALFHLRNGELRDDPTLLRWMQATVSEAEAVARAEGVNLVDSFSRVLEVCRLTAANHSSMLQDMSNGRETEIDSLCGVIVRLGEKHGIATPYNSALVQLVEGAENSEAAGVRLGTLG